MSEYHLRGTVLNLDLVHEPHGRHDERVMTEVTLHGVGVDVVKVHADVNLNFHPSEAPNLGDLVVVDVRVMGRQ